MADQPKVSLLERVRFRGAPVANRESVIMSNSARFTVLTPRLLRLEWSESGEFEDRGTYAFPTRTAPAPSFHVRTEGNTLLLDTGNLVLRYKQSDGKFTASNLSIAFDLNGVLQTWVPGTPDPGNLRGTRRTLDRCEGQAALEEGLLSRTGWVLFDDSHSVVFDADGWVAPRPRQETQDWYFFGYGHDYKGALADYTLFGGKIPLIPRYVLGAWWSRYWAYSDQELQQLVRDFEEHDLPLDVLVLDMDWHTPHSWTGYTWNRNLFPNPPAFIRWVHENGLRVTMNLHPAQGVQPFEEVYPRFADAMGMDPSSQSKIPFRSTDRKFIQNYFELLHHPLESDGVDFWWLDWQQGESSEMVGLDPLPWLNHLHFQDSTRREMRPILYSRWGGLGNHRYPIGFSGDTYAYWSALQFQPYFTATASNVAFGWWSHDIGGHMGGATEPELYARWVQFGALSPCLRLHATKDPRAERRPWIYPKPVFQAAKAAFHWRYQLVPYIYSMARLTYDSGVSLCRPMYYESPEDEAAYMAREQYFFGDQMIVAPIVHPAQPQTGLATADIWIPPGTWTEYTTKETFAGPGWVRIVGDLSCVPMLMKEGAILPLALPFDRADMEKTPSTTEMLSRERMILSVFPGKEGRFRLYEDDGCSDAYRGGQFEWTEIVTRMEHLDTWEVFVAPVEGFCDGLASQRGYEVRLEGSLRPDRIDLDGMIWLDWEYDPDGMRTAIHVPPRDKRQAIKVTAFAAQGISALGDEHNKRLRMSDAAALLRIPDSIVPQYESLLEAALYSTEPGQADALARLGGPFARYVEFAAPDEASRHLGRVIVAAPTQGPRAFDLKLTFQLYRNGQIEQHHVQLKDVTESQVVDTPFAFDGRVETEYWTAQTEISWRGAVLTHDHQSTYLFPTIPVWQVATCQLEEEPRILDQLLDDQVRQRDVLGWLNHRQTLDQVLNLNSAHGVFLSKVYRKELASGDPLVGLLLTTITSPDERDVVLWYRAGGIISVHLNGQRVEECQDGQEEELHALLHRARRTVATRLRAGENRLVIRTLPPGEADAIWFFGGALMTPDNQPMTDLSYK